MLRWS